MQARIRSRHAVAAGLALALTAGCASAVAAGAVRAPRPNLLVILADDLGRGDYSAFGTKDIRTPNLDRLCREGLTFDNFYANSCVCSPTRAALLTGCYPDRVGVPGVIREETPDDSWGCLSGQATLLPQALRRAGYRSDLVGKWHLGIASPNTPTERGFDFFHGFLGDMMDDYWTHLKMDIFPTLCEAAGVKPPAGIDGVSFWPTLLGQPEPERKRDLYFVRREGGPLYCGKTIEALIRGDWKLVQDSPFAPLELYDLRNDSLETTNCAAKEKTALGGLAAALRQQVQCGGQVPWQARTSYP